MKRDIFIVLMILILNSSIFSAEQKAYVAGGCFWCTEADMEKIPGVINVVSGYSGGSTVNPNYKEVSLGITGHFETIEITYQNDTISYEELIEKFLFTIDTQDDQGQFVDRGQQYSPAIFYSNNFEKESALKAFEAIKKAGNFNEIKVKLIPFSNFYIAEDYHQDYSIKNPLKYKYYRFNSGRDQYLEKTWKNIKTP